MKNNHRHIHHYHHADPLFYKIRPFALALLAIILVLGLAISVCGILGVFD